MPVKISYGNDKIGNAWSVSLLPVVTCDRRAGCARCFAVHGHKGGCYARKFVSRPSVRAAWTHNTTLARNPRKFFAELHKQLPEGTPPRWFRWFVAGDAPSFSFLRDIFTFAEDHPQTRFLLFTKRYKWVSDLLETRPLPSNLSAVLSSWPGFPLNNPHHLPVAWMLDPSDPDPRIPADAIPRSKCPPKAPYRTNKSQRSSWTDTK